MVETRSLGDLIEAGIIEATNGFAFGGHNSDGSGVAHIRPFNVTTNGEIILDQIKSIPAEAVLDKPRLRRRDVVFNNTNTKELVGKCALWNQDNEPVFSNHMTRVRVREDACDAAYLSFAILHHWMVGRSEMLARAHVAQASIMGERFREIEVPWRNLAEQRAISMIIAGIRESCRWDIAQVKNTQRLKAATMHHVLTRGLRGEMQKETEIGFIPVSWNLTRLADCARLDRGRFMHRPRNEPRFYGGDMPFVQTGDVVASNGRIREFSQTLNEAGVAISRVFPAGTILITIAANIGFTGILQFDAACPDSLIAVTAGELISAEFLEYFLQTQRSEMDRLAPKGTQKNINLQFLSPWPVPLPTPAEQSDIVAILHAIDRKIELHQKKRGVLEELFKGLLHKLVTGDLRVDQVSPSALGSPEQPDATA